MNIYILDVGQTRYGDCIFITRSGKSILIDGAHAKDADSIKQQLSGILKKQPPFNIDLLVVSHCHSDHIGCLPKLVAEGSLIFDSALVADENLGFGKQANGRGPTDGITNPVKKALVTIMMEEDHSDMQGADLREFLADAANLEDSYKSMLSQLKDSGTKIIRYLGLQETKGLAALQKKFSDFGLVILGPTQEHLLLCTDVLAKAAQSQGDDLNQTLPDSFSMNDLATAYKQSVAKFYPDAEEGQDRVGPGAAKNDQSIVLKVKAEGWTALLAADMQFAVSEVPGLDVIMAKLLEDVNSAGPYDLVKLTHHTSYNGLNEDIFKKWNEKTKLFAHTGGLNDKDHPDPGSLDILKKYKGKFNFARTDRNGLITVKKNGGLAMTPSKGKLNNFDLNNPGDEEVPSKQHALLTHSLNQPIVQNIPIFSSEQQPITPNDEQFVEVITRIPHISTRVIVTIDIDPEKKNAELPLAGMGVGNIHSPDSSRLANLVFVTSSGLLARNIGKTEANGVLVGLAKKNILVDLPTGMADAKQAAELVRKKISKETKGIVIIGGYDVVPSLQMDVIDSGLRAKILAQNKDNLDADNFIVWTDDIYGDTDGDLIPELPVSRIPDARRSDLVINALNCSPVSMQNKFGIRNRARPFAEIVFNSVKGQGSGLAISEVFGPADIDPGSASGSVYFMLHGSSSDSTRFWGETANGDSFEAVNIKNIPDSTHSTVIFTGCCWAGLSVYPPACMKTPTIEIRPKTPEESIALKYLLSGAQGFIGCTGSHYSPLAPPYNYFGKPMHDSFWKAINSGNLPAQALFSAKQEFGKNIPHGQQDPYSQAVELKILWQYTCLGLGW